MELKEFAAHVSAKFNIKKIEPWSEHFRSLDKAYLEELRAAVAQAGGGMSNVGGTGEDHPFPRDIAQRGEAISFSKQWGDGAAGIGVTSVRAKNPPSRERRQD